MRLYKREQTKMINTIDDLLNSNDVIVRNTAIISSELQKNLKGGIITQEEYEDLADDLLDLARIDKLATSIEHKAKLAEAFEFLKTFIGAVI